MAIFFPLRVVHRVHKPTYADVMQVLSPSPGRKSMQVDATTTDLVVYRRSFGSLAHQFYDSGESLALAAQLCHSHRYALQSRWSSQAL